MKSFKEFITEEEEEIIIPKVHIWGALFSGNYWQISAALKSPNFTKEHLDWAIKNKNAWIAEAALKSPHHTKEHIDLAMKNRSAHVVSVALHSPHATKEQITDAMNRWRNNPREYGGWIFDSGQRELNNRNNDESQQP